jgi:hypothetical protein
MHNNRNMVIHVRPNIPQKARRNDTHHSKRNTRIINPFVALRVRYLARRNNSLVRSVAVDAGDFPQLRQQRGAGELDGLGDEGFVSDMEIAQHDAADVMLGVDDEFRDEDVVVDAVADGAADYAD